jgi:hypothetical protein
MKSKYPPPNENKLQYDYNLVIVRNPDNSMQLELFSGMMASQGGVVFVQKKPIIFGRKQGIIWK